MISLRECSNIQCQFNWLISTCEGARVSCKSKALIIIFKKKCFGNLVKIQHDNICNILIYLIAHQSNFKLFILRVFFVCCFICLNCFLEQHIWSFGPKYAKELHVNGQDRSQSFPVPHFRSYDQAKGNGQI